MEGKPTYTQAVPKRRAYTVDSESDAATADMPTMPFEERVEEDTVKHRP